MENLKTKIAKWLANTDSNSTEKEQLYQLKKLIHSVENRNIELKKPSLFSDLVAENIEKMKQSKNENFIATGFEVLDKERLNFNLGEFIVIGGRPAMGKTQLLINLALNISQNVPVLYFTFDMSRHLLSQRIMGTVLGVGWKKIQQKSLNQNEKEKLLQGQDKFNKFQLYINDETNSSISTLKEQCEKMIAEKGVKVIFIDYLQLMSSYRFSNRGNRENEIAYISRSLKELAKNNNVCVVVSSQLSRSVETRGGEKRPILSDLRESGAIEQDADKVIFLHRPEYYGFTEDEMGESVDGIANLIIAKNRNGNTDTVQLRFVRDVPTFLDLGDNEYDFSFAEDRLSEIEKMEKENPNFKDFRDRFGIEDKD